MVKQSDGVINLNWYSSEIEVNFKKIIFTKICNRLDFSGTIWPPPLERSAGLMKIKLELEINVVMDIFSPTGTNFYGYLPDGTTYDDIIKVFGQPQFGKSPDGKMQAEWVGRINGLVFTIYDYKSRVFPQYNKDWHVGGESKFTAELIKAYFQARLSE